MTTPKPHVGIIVQNLPVPLDRRVWNECRALIAAGYDVSVICPKGPGDPASHELEGVQLHKYAPPPARDGIAALVYETVYCWLRTAWLAARIHRRHPFDAIQACNPPDTFWLLGAIFKARGVRFVFDHHDLCPEIYMARYREDGLVLRLLLALERATFGTADHVISTNESYRAVALRRGRRRREETTVVRSGPQPHELKPAEGDPTLKRGRRYLCCYVGIMGHQDGADLIVRAADLIVNHWGHDDVSFALLGFGDTLESLRALSTELGLDGHITFTGRVGTAEIQRYLTSSDIGLSPDPRSLFNEASTMNKTLEYMACALPVVAYDLRETRVSAGAAAAYAADDSVEAFAAAITSLLDDPAARAEMGRIGRSAIEERLGWPSQVPAYIEVYDRLLGRVGDAERHGSGTRQP